MTEGSWISRWREAYIDLHVAYLAVVRMRNMRKQASSELTQRDMFNKDPFYMEGAPGEEAVQKWQELWKKNQSENEMSQTMACVSESMQEHWKSWAAFMELCPDEMKKSKISVPFDDYLMTATTVSRSTLESRAKALAEARQNHLLGG
ncbi:MAG: hypothetical protein ACYTFG_03155 [Planctomycetota bacterium]|jgi:hypothetical protein